MGAVMPRHARARQGTAAADDAALIERSRRGETEAFESLMAKYANLVGSIAYDIVGDVHVAGDITQDTFLKVFRNLQNLEDPPRTGGLSARRGRGGVPGAHRRPRRGADCPSGAPPYLLALLGAYHT